MYPHLVSGSFYNTLQMWRDDANISLHFGGFISAIKSTLIETLASTNTNKITNANANANTPTPSYRHFQHSYLSIHKQAN